jgi:signal transduction histidine kinase/DNA-binding response OmpR family regulator
LTIDVTRRGDYGLRARAHSADEIGALVHGFNAMLSQIAERDRELQRHRESLEELVVERTGTLERANDRLSQLLQQTAENRQSIEAANSAKTEFLTRINQELRTLTTGLATSMDLMSSMARGSRARPFAEIAQSCADGLLRVLNDTFESLRNNNANVQLECNDFDLRRALIETVQIYAWRAQEKGLELLLDIDTRLDSYVRGDALRLRQVLMNLLSNAVKFTTRGLVLVRVRQLQRGTDDIRVSFEISDTGIGIRAENRSTTFASVVTGAGARSQVGPAVGLLVTRELVELMQGKISVESEFGRGSNFELELQFKTSLQSASDIEPALVPGRRILLIDDSQACRELLQNQLTQAGLEVTPAADGVAAQRLLEVARRDQRLPAVIVIDAAMPQLDGVETLRRLRDDPTLPRIPAVLLCPLDFEFDDELQRELTPSVAIRKPVQLSQLSIAMTEVLTLRATSTPGFSATTSVTSDAPALSDTAEMTGTVTHIAEHFVSEVAAALAELDAALERQDAPAAASALDLLTVASERLGLPALSSACDAANKNVAKGQLAAAKRVRPALEELRRRAIDRFKRYLTGAVA